MVKCDEQDWRVKQNVTLAVVNPGVGEEESERYTLPSTMKVKKYATKQLNKK